MIYDFCLSDLLSHTKIPIRTDSHGIPIMGLEIIGKNEKNWCMKTIRQSPQKLKETIDAGPEMAKNGKF